MDKNDLKCKNSWEQIELEWVGKEPWRAVGYPKEVQDVIEHWQEKLYKDFKNWVQLYYSKLVTIKFEYKGQKYEITAGQLNVPDAYLEPRAGGIVKDLEAIGCENVYDYGFAD